MASGEMSSRDKMMLWIAGALFLLAAGIFWWRTRPPAGSAAAPAPAEAASQPAATEPSPTTTAAAAQPQAAPTPPPAPPTSDPDAMRPYLRPLSDTVLFRPRRQLVRLPERDPFASRVVVVAVRPDPGPIQPPPAPPPRTEYVLSGILFGANRPIAFINDLSFAVGDRLPGGATLTAIEERRVVITESNGSRRVLTLPP